MGQPGPPGEVFGLSGALAQFFTSGGYGSKGPESGYQHDYQQYYQNYFQGYNQHQYYQADSKLKVDDVIKRNLDGFNALYNVFKTADKVFLGGDGTRNNPARSCLELFQWHLGAKTGDYWVDPNEGSPDDSVLVHCDKATNETCVYAKNAQVIFPLMNFFNLGIVWVT